MNINSNRRLLLFSMGLVAILAFPAAQFAQAQVQVSPNEPDRQTLKVASKPRLLVETESFSSEIRAIAFSADSQYVAASTDSDVRIWHIATGELFHTIRGFSTSDSGVITSLDVNPADGSLAIGVETSRGGTLRTCAIDSLDDTKSIWGDPKDANDPLSTVTSFGQRSARALTYSSDGKYLAFLASFLGSDDQGNSKLGLQYIFLDRQTGKVHHSNPAQDLDDGATSQDFGAQKFRQAGRFLGSDRYYIMPGLNEIFDVKTKQPVGYDASPDLQWFDRFLNRLGPNLANLSNVVLSSDANITKRKGAVAYSAKLNGRDLYQCDVFIDENPKPAISYKGLGWSPTATRLSGDAKVCAVGDALGRLHVFSTDTGKAIFKTKSTVRASYSAAVDQKSGILAFGQTPHSGQAWKFNDYADLDRGFDLRNRKLIDNPSGDFPRAKASIYGITAKRKKGPKGTFVEVSLAGQESYISSPATKAFFTQTLAKGNDADQVLLFRGGAGFLGADAVQIGPVKQGRYSVGKGALVAAAETGKTSAASDITLTADENFVVGAWTDGAISIYRKSDFAPRDLGALGFEIAVPDAEELMKDPEFVARMQADPSKMMELVQQFRVNKITDPTVGKQIRVGDQILLINDQKVPLYLGEFYNVEEGNEPGDEITVLASRDGKEFSAKLQLIDDGVEIGANYVSPILTFVTTRSDEWILFTPEGYYDASLGGHDLIGWKVNRGPNETANFFTARQLRKSLYRPEVIENIIAGIVQGDVNATTIKVASVGGSKPNRRKDPVLDIREPESLQSILPPVVTVDGLPQSGQVTTDTVSFTINAKTQNSLRVQSIVVLIDGRSTVTDAAKMKTADDGSVTLAHSLSIPPGEHNIAVVATNSAGSATKTFRLYREGPKEDRIMPKMYLLAIGVSDYKDDSLDLRYAANDAEAFAEMMSNQKGKFYRDVEVKLLTDKDASREGILKGMEWLLDNATQNDVATLFLSGHGTFGRGQHFYFCNHEIDSDSLRSTGLSYNDIEDTIANMPCNTIVFADTCHSGAVRGTKSVRRDPWADLVSDEVGGILFASSIARDESLELDEFKHGAFTRAVLDAFEQRKADINGDGFLGINELTYHIPERVKELTQGRQRSAHHVPSTIPNFNIAVSGKE